MLSDLIVINGIKGNPSKVVGFEVVVLLTVAVAFLRYASMELL